MEEVNKAINEVKTLQEITQSKFKAMTDAQFDYIIAKNKLKVANIKLSGLLAESKPVRRKYPRPDNEYKKDFIRENGNKCSKCNTDQGLTVHHITPLALGGTNEKSNLKVLCLNCHSGLHAEW